MSDTSHDHAAHGPTGFFDMPREIRDQIYEHICEPTKLFRGRTGNIADYAQLPNINLLRVNEQLRAEFSPFLKPSLKRVLLQNRVCLHFPATHRKCLVDDTDGHQDYITAGWSFVDYHWSYVYYTSVWVNTAVCDVDQGMVAWWAAATNLDIWNNKDPADRAIWADGPEVSDAFLQFKEQLREMLLVVGPQLQMDEVVIQRLNVVMEKLTKGIDEASKRATRRRPWSDSGGMIVEWESMRGERFTERDSNSSLRV